MFAHSDQPGMATAQQMVWVWRLGHLFIWQMADRADLRFYYVPGIIENDHQ